LDISILRRKLNMANSSKPSSSQSSPSGSTTNEKAAGNRASTSSKFDPNTVRVLNLDEYLGATQCLAEAFAEDVVARYFIDTPDMAKYDEAYKWKLHVSILKYVVAAHCMKGLVTCVGPDYDAVALW
jgi:hypothetical protein